MDTQLKKGLLEACVLAVLKKGESYGYLITKDMMDYIEVSESTLYPVLKRLEAAGCVITYTVEHNGRLRKYYQITDIGKGRITEYLVEFEEIKKIYSFIEGAANSE